MSAKVIPLTKAVLKQNNEDGEFSQALVKVSTNWAVKFPYIYLLRSNVFVVLQFRTKLWIIFLTIITAAFEYHANVAYIFL